MNKIFEEVSCKCTPDEIVRLPKVGYQYIHKFVCPKCGSEKITYVDQLRSDDNGTDNKK